MKKLLLLVTLSVVLFGCTSTNMLTLTITEPAPVSLPGNVKSVGIVNRAKSAENMKKLNKADEILTLELQKVDSTSSLQAIAGLNAELLKNNNFNNVVLLPNIKLTNSVPNTFSPVISKNEVQNICNKNNLNALFVLEYLDTDSKINYAATPATINVAGVAVKAVETMATVNSALLIGWRIYNASGDELFDEYGVVKNVTSTGRGINPMTALNAVMGHKTSVEKSAYAVGQEYAWSLLPYNIRVSRDYFVRGTDKFKIAMRRARAGNWDGAAELWAAELNNPDMKVAGRAHYNMAISNEINGNLDKAIEFAEKSYTDYNNKLALDYLNVLKNRRARNNELQRQLNK